jgi:hypothetical protein
MFWKVCRKENRLRPTVSSPRLSIGIEESEWRQFRKYLFGEHKKILQQTILHSKIILPFFVQFNKSVIWREFADGLTKKGKKAYENDKGMSF